MPALVAPPLPSKTSSLQDKQPNLMADPRTAAALENLLGMGFERPLAERALDAANGNVQLATSLLLDSPPTSMPMQGQQVQQVQQGAPPPAGQLPQGPPQFRFRIFTQQRQGPPNGEADAEASGEASGEAAGDPMQQFRFPDGPMAPMGGMPGGLGQQMGGPGGPMFYVRSISRRVSNGPNGAAAPPNSPAGPPPVRAARRAHPGVGAAGAANGIPRMAGVGGRPPFPLGFILEIASEFMRSAMEAQQRTAARPPSAEAIKQLACGKVTKSHATSSASDPCPVCQDCFSAGDDFTRMPCQHDFHSDCLSPWLSEHNTCPTCRYELDTADKEYNENVVEVQRTQRAEGLVTRLSGDYSSASVSDLKEILRCRKVDYSAAVEKVRLPARRTSASAPHTRTHKVVPILHFDAVHVAHLCIDPGCGAVRSSWSASSDSPSRPRPKENHRSRPKPPPPVSTHGSSAAGAGPRPTPRTRPAGPAPPAVAPALRAEKQAPPPRRPKPRRRRSSE